MAAAVAPGTPAAAVGEVTEQTTAPEAKPANEAEAKKPEPKKAPKAETPEQARQANIEKFAKKMNAEAEKDGVEIDAPDKERRGKPGPKPGNKRPAVKPEAEAQPTKLQPAAPPAKAAPAKDDEASEATQADAVEVEDDDAETGTPEPRSSLQLKAKARLRHGDVDKALRLAFGDLKPDEFDTVREALTKRLEPNSKKWADFRRIESQTKRELDQRVQKLTTSAQTLEREYRPLVEARKAMKEGRRADAFKLAFGEDINDFQRAALREELSADAGTARLQNEVQTLKREIEDLKTGKVQRTPEAEKAEQAQNERRGKDRIYEALQKSEDAEVRRYGLKTAFIDRVWNIRLQHFDPATKTTIPLHLAAEIARDETRKWLKGWSDDEESTGSSAPNTESPGLAGNEPVRSSQRARSPNPSQAAGGGVSTRSMDREARIKAYARAMGS